MESKTDLTGLISTLVRTLEEIAAQVAERTVIETLSAMAFNPREEKTSQDLTNLVDALQIAPLLGRPVPTGDSPSDQRERKNVRTWVNDLARNGHIPSVQVKPRRRLFNPAAVKVVLNQGGLAQADKQVRVPSSAISPGQTYSLKR